MGHDSVAEQKRAERAHRKAAAAKKREAGQADSAGGAPILEREWVRVNEGVPVDAHARRVRVVSWNMLAQSLVRRELFPGSDCLKFRTRLPGIVAEMKMGDWDVGCFQEVDSLEEVAPPLSKAGYTYVYERGYTDKKHGVMIAWRSSESGNSTCFGMPVLKKVVRLDEVSTWDDGVDGASLSRLTRNVLLVLALPYASGEGGVVVATSHLFWHPRYSYERARQAAAIMRELSALRQAGEPWSAWPLVLAGDLNDQPHSSTYSLLTGQALAHRDRVQADLQMSRVVHTSVDELRGLRTVHYASTVTEDGDADRVLGRHRPAQDRELLTPDQLISLAKMESGVPGRPSYFQSAYASAYEQLGTQAEFFCDRGTAPERYDQTELPMPTDPRQLQSHEPKWTLYSSLFHLTLDYILLAPRTQPGGPDYPLITALLPLHPESALRPGVPRQSVCSSDHILLGAELAL